jgi:proteic killer suppression protein
MIRSFGDKETEQLFNRGKSKRLPADLIKRALRRLAYIHYATHLNDLKVPPSNRLHALKGDRKVNMRFRSTISGASASDSSTAMPSTFK